MAFFNLIRTGNRPGAIRGRVAELARRCGDLSPLAEPVRDRLWEGNAEMLLAGQNFDGTPAAPLRPATLKNRKGTGPPRVPQGRNSRAVRDCVVTVEAGPGRLAFLKSWPGFTRGGAPVAEFLSLGTYRMAARPMHGFRRQDLDWVRGQLRGYVVDGKGPGFFGRLFGG